MFKRFLAYILDPQGRSYYLKQTNEAATTSMPTPLPEMFEGWQGMEVGYERDLKTFGLKRSFTLPVAALFSLARMLRHIVFTRSTEEKLSLLIQKLRPSVGATTFTMPYDYWYKGDVDLSSYQYGDDRDTIGIREGGVKQLIDLYEDTDYELSIADDPEAQRVLMDGFPLRQTAEYFFVDDYEIRSRAAGGLRALPVAHLQPEGRSSGLGFFDQQYQNLNGLSRQQTLEQVNSIVEAQSYNTTPIIAEIRGKGIPFRFTESFEGYFVLYLQSSLAGGAEYILFSTFNPVKDQVYTFDINQDIPVRAGERLYLRFQSASPLPFVFEYGIVFQKNSFTISYKNRFRATYVDGLTLPTIIRRSCEKMGLKPSEIDTTYLQQFDRFVILPGDSLRGLENPRLKISFTDVAEFIRVVKGVGRAVENNTLLFNSYSYFLNPANPLFLGEASEVKVKPLNELKGSALEVGYPKQDTDETNGRYSFNNTIKRTTPSTVKGVISFISRIITDPYVIEDVRQNLDGQDTTDNGADEQAFALNTAPLNSIFTTIVFDTTGGNFITVTGGEIDRFPLNRRFEITSTGGSSFAGFYTPISATVVGSDLRMEVKENLTPGSAYGVVVYAVRTLLRVPYDSIAGVPEPATLFNIEDFTPARILDAQRLLLNSIFSDPALFGAAIKFDSGEKNTDLVTTRNGVTYNERADFVIGAQKLFKNWLFEIKIRMLEDSVDILEANPNQCVSFTWLGDTYEGFIIKAVASANDSREQALTLLATPNCNLTNLIVNNG